MASYTYNSGPYSGSQNATLYNATFTSSGDIHHYPVTTGSDTRGCYAPNARVDMNRTAVAGQMPYQQYSPQQPALQQEAGSLPRMPIRGQRMRGNMLQQVMPNRSPGPSSGALSGMAAVASPSPLSHSSGVQSVRSSATPPPNYEDSVFASEFIESATSYPAQPDSGSTTRLAAGTEVKNLEPYTGLYDAVRVWAGVDWFVRTFYVCLVMLVVSLGFSYFLL